MNQQMNDNLSKNVENLTKSLEEEKVTSSKLRKEWEEYRKETTKALEQLLEEIAKDEDSSSLAKQNLLTFPDETLSAMQVEAVKKRNHILGKYQLKI